MQIDLSVFISLTDYAVLWCTLCTHRILSNCYDIFVSIGLFKTNDSLILQAIEKEYNCVYLDTNLIQWKKKLWQRQSENKISNCKKGNDVAVDAIPIGATICTWNDDIFARS